MHKAFWALLADETFCFCFSIFFWLVYRLRSFMTVNVLDKFQTQLKAKKTQQKIIKLS